MKDITILMWAFLWFVLILMLLLIMIITPIKYYQCKITYENTKFFIPNICKVKYEWEYISEELYIRGYLQNIKLK